MNADEARRYLIEISYIFGTMSIQYLTEKDGEKMREALNVLEQESRKDCISREDVLELIYDIKEKHTEDNKGYPINYATLLDIIRLIRELPSVTQEPKTGHWTRELIRNEKGGCIGAKMICSRCGKDNKHDEYMDYCPNCGAKMVEPQESEDRE